MPYTVHVNTVEAEFLDEIQTNSRSLLFQLLETVKRKEEYLIEKHAHVPYGFRNPYRNLKAENSREYGQKPQQNCTFMNSASVQYIYTYVF